MLDHISKEEDSVLEKQLSDCSLYTVQRQRSWEYHMETEQKNA